MKGRFKDRAKQVTLIVLFLIISVLTITLVGGRINTQEILVVKKQGINAKIPLDQQLEFFETKEILKSEMEFFKGTVVTNKQQLKGKMTLNDLKVGSPIPFSSLMDPKGAGQFAAVMPEGRTVHLLSQAKLGLPPIQEGDLINIALVYKEKVDDGTEAIRVGMLMTDVEIYRTGEADLFVNVSLEESLVLHTAAQLGTFIYQVPGQKVELPEDGTEEIPTEVIPDVIEQSDIFEAILNKTYAGAKENIDNAIEGSTDDAEDISNNVVKPTDETTEDEENGNENDDSEDNTGGENDEQQN